VFSDVVLGDLRSRRVYVTKYYSDDQIKEVKMGDACSTRKRK
jgi:hypothetical protein